MKSKTIIPEGWTHLASQSTLAYALLKNEAEKLYYIKCMRDSKMALVGDIEAAYDLVLFGLHEMSAEVKEFFPTKKEN